MSINIFSAEYIMHPIGLELSQNSCGHNCFYCFDKFKDSSRRADIKSFVAQMNAIRKGESIVARKIKEGYPVCYSNNTDPFAKNNEALTREQLPAMLENGVNIFFQTKTGENMFDIIDGISPQTFYLSITSLSDSISKEIEPQAPVISKRLMAIEELKKRGHHVVVGINPLAEEWLPEQEFSELTNILNGLGVSSIAVGLLYFRKKNTERLEKFKKAGVDILDYTKGNSSKMQFFKKVVINNYEKGLIAPNMPLFCYGIDGFVNPAHKHIKTIFGFVNQIIKRAGDEVLKVTFLDYFEYFNECTFLDGQNLDGIIFSISPRNWVGKKENQKIKDKRAFYKILWNMTSAPQNLSMNRLFLKADEKDEEGNSTYFYMGGRHVNIKGEFISLL